MIELLNYIINIAPGFFFSAIILILLNKRSPLLHLVIFILLFIFTRDAMTPLKLWDFGTNGFFWLRFTNNWVVLIVSGLSSLILVFTMNHISEVLKDLIVWFKGNRLTGIIVGVFSAVLVALPLLVLYINVDITIRGGDVSKPLLPALLFLCITGNFYEEVLFRGYLQGWLEQKLNFNIYKSGILSGLFFGFGHIFLAFNVSDIGWALVIFATWEGCITGLVRAKWGVIPATLTHGLAIFILSSSLI